MLRSSISRRGVFTAALFPLVLAGCSENGPTPSDVSPRAHVHHTDRSTWSQAEIARALNDLRTMSAPWHNLEKAHDAGFTDYSVGCLDEIPFGGTRGMGIHVTEPGFGLVLDGDVDLMVPEFLVYEVQKGSGELKLAAFDYFVFANEKYPAPDDPAYIEGETEPTLLGMRFNWNEVSGGWMFHIWLWKHNPDGMFADFNPNVALCS